MTAVDSTAPAAPQAGRTTLTARALHRLAAGIARDAARVPVDEVSVVLADHGGALRASVVLPVAVGEHDGASLVERGSDVRRALIDGFEQLAARRVGAVDIRFTGIRELEERRVR